MNGPVIDFYANVSATLYTLILNHTLSTSWTETTTSNFLLESNNTTTYAGINLNGSSTNL